MKMLVEKSKTAQVSRVLRIAPPVPRRVVVKLRDGEFIGGRKRETTSTQEKRRTKAEVLKLDCQGHLPREGSLIPLLAGLLTLVSTDWPPSRPLRVRSISQRRPRGQWHSGQPSTITVAGPCRILTGFPIELTTHQKRCSSWLRSFKRNVKRAKSDLKWVWTTSHREVISPRRLQRLRLGIAPSKSQSTSPL